MARACRFQFHLGPFRAAFLALLLIACASGTAIAGTKAEHLYLLAGTPLRDETDSYPVTLYVVGPNGRLEAVRQIFSKKQGLFDVRGDLEGRLYVMNQWQNVLSVINESNPEGVDTVKGNFGGMYETAWGVVAPPGQESSVTYPAWCNDHCWKLWAISGDASASPRIFPGNWSLYRWFRYRGTPVTPRGAVIPEGNIAGGEVVLPDLARPSGGAAVKGKLARGSGPAENVGTVGAVPPRLPPSVGAHSITVGDKAGWHQVTVRDVAIVADTARFFAVAALPFYSKEWPVPVYVQNKTTGGWTVVDTPFVRLWPRVSGSWLATTVEEPNPSGKESPGLKNERTLPRYAYIMSDLPQVRGLYGTKTFMPGKLLLQNLLDGRKLTIETGQQDSEVLYVRKDGLVLYRVNDEIFSAKIEDDKLSAPKLVVKGEDVPEVHWVFWSKAGTKPQVLAEGEAHKRPPITLRLEAPKQPFSVTLEAPNRPLKAGAELPLFATIKNTSNHDISFVRSSGGTPEEWFRYKITVLGVGGRPVPPSARVLEIRKLRNEKKPVIFQVLHNSGQTLKPGQSFVDKIDVTKVYDLSQPGVYTIWVRRYMPPKVTPHGVEWPKGSVRSNTITVTVVK